MARTERKLREVIQSAIQRVPWEIGQLLMDIVTNLKGTAGNVPKYEAGGVGFEDSGVGISALVTLTGTQTLQNKTIITPTLSMSGDGWTNCTHTHAQASRGGQLIPGNIFSSAYLKDEDDMASNSASALATQQSIKAYVDAAIAAHEAAYH